MLMLIVMFYIEAETNGLWKTFLVLNQEIFLLFYTMSQVSLRQM